MTPTTESEDDRSGVDSERKRLQGQFEENPSIENYVALRRHALDANPVAYRFGGIDPLYSMEPELKKVGLDPLLVCGVLDGDERDIDELCLQLMERLIARKQLEARGQTHVQSRGMGISNSLIHYLIMTMLEALRWNGVQPTSSLLVLVRERLGGPNPELFTGHPEHRIYPYLLRNLTVVRPDHVWCADISAP